MDLTHIRLDIRDGIATVTLNRPEARNAFSAEMHESLDKVLNHIRSEARSEIKVIIITGTNGAFCAGGNIKGMGERHQATAVESRRRMRMGHRLLKDLRDLEMPVIAAVDGPAAGAGCNLALACDFILASPRARFIQAFIRIGLVPDWGGMYLLPRIVGIQRAKELMFSGRTLGAEEAKQIGLVLEVYPEEDFQLRVREFAGRFVHASTDAIGLTKNILNQTFDIDFNTALDLEAHAQSAIRSSEYHRDSVDRFIAKQPLKFHWDQMEKTESPNHG